MSGLQASVLRLVKGGPERQALDAGQVDAVIDSATGNVFLLPVARRALSPQASGEPDNSLLAALPPGDYQRLLADLEPLTLTCGQVLYEPGDRVRHVYFPGSAHVSLLVVADGKALEVSLVGREGMVGVPLALGVEASPVRALVQGTGSALRMKAEAFHKALERSPALLRELHRYACAKLAQARQTAACNRFHRVEARLARWLLMTRDRVRSDHFHLTHAFLADVLGVRRVGVTNAASDLQRRRLIRYRRGNISILDRKGLRAASCPCYEVLRSLAS